MNTTDRYRREIDTGLGRILTVCRVGTEGNISIKGEGITTDRTPGAFSALPMSVLDDLIGALLAVKNEINHLSGAR